MLLDRKSFFIRERVGVMKIRDVYDILDPESGAQIGIAREVSPTWAVVLRMVIDKRMMPTSVLIQETEESTPVVQIHRGWTLFRAKIYVTNERGEKIGYFKSKFITLGGGFYVYDMQDNQVAEVKGDWVGWNFRFLDTAGNEIGLVTKKWAGLGKEFFTSADNYLISIHDRGDHKPETSALLLAAGIAIDTIYKER